MQSNSENVGMFIEAWKLMVGRLPGAEIEQADGVATMLGHVPLPFFNFSVIDRPLADADDLRGALAVIRKRASACEYASMTGLCDAWAPVDWVRVAAEEGFAVAMNTTGMEAPQLLPPRRPLPDLDLRRVNDEATARDLAMVNAAAYGMPGELFECMCNLYLWHEDSHGYVGYAEGRAVTAAAAFPVAGTVYMALVATLPEAHGKGYAEAVMRHAIAEAQRAMGFSRVTLHATDMGQPLYQAMGFGAGAKVVVLVQADGSAGH
ncbi:GNAT family N-acetyltransferase [uncultured Paludibaculum sp.]|uniref:GNAT family N-acetyltransferase n=1 Tax=uncultured Paludibaculum sp. TaxID=1765020 RepID=UPI002AAAE54A|nr:GNAT family N-acetyltransferase [uncultured Paludibaculum sp.]